MQRSQESESKSNPTPPFLPQPHQFCGKSFLDQGLEHTLGGSIIQEEEQATSTWVSHGVHIYIALKAELGDLSL